IVSWRREVTQEKEKTGKNCVTEKRNDTEKCRKGRISPYVQQKSMDETVNFPEIVCNKCSLTMRRDVKQRDERKNMNGQG
ncbi:MAG: hypothetical protein LUE92_06845, partial [Clostridiales bacterium]|nr:hypothetical protein [Clostridiales bacterium]